MSSARGQRSLAEGPGHRVQRRKQVLQGMADGLTARQVAHRLGISRRTVEGHLRVLRELTGARSIGELCAVSVAEGWVTPGRLAPGVALSSLGARTLAGPEPRRSRPETGWFPDGLTMFPDGLTMFPDGLTMSDGKLADVGSPPGSMYPAGRGYPAGLEAPADPAVSTSPAAPAGSGASRPLAEPARAAASGRADSAARNAAEPADRTGRRPGGRPTVLTPDRVAAARQLLPAQSVTDTARRLGLSRSTLYAHLPEINEAGLEDTPPTGSTGPP